MLTLTCYGCHDLERDCCGSAAVEECFSGLLIDLSGDYTHIYPPFDVYVDSSGAYVSDSQGHYYDIALSDTDFGTIEELETFLTRCKCGGNFHQEWFGVSGTSLTFTENNGHIPLDENKCHLLVDGREKRQGEWSVSGGTITTTFNIFTDNRVIFWYQLF